MNTTTVPTIQDFLLLFINSFFTTTTTLTTAVLALVPSIVQLGINYLFSLFQGGTSGS